MAENFSWEGMWRLSANSNSLVDKLMSTFTEDKCRRNKRMTAMFCVRANLRFVLEKMKVEFEQKFLKEGEN